MIADEFVMIFEFLATFLSVAALVFLIHGALGAMVAVYRIEFFGKKRFHPLEHTKRRLIQKMIFALDFFVIADLIRLAFMDFLADIVQIALIVTVRTVLSWSLGREIHLHKE